MASDTEVDKDSGECQQQSAAQYKQRAGMPLAVLVDWLEIVGERMSKCRLEIGLRILAVECAHRLARFFRRHIAINVRTHSTTSTAMGPLWLLPKCN